MAPRFIGYTCSACGTEHHIPRALFIDCPSCQAEPGERCVDLRKGRNRMPRVSPHPAREDRLRIIEDPISVVVS